MNMFVEEGKGFNSGAQKEVAEGNCLMFWLEAQINKLKKRTGSVQERIKKGRRDQVYVKDGKVFCSV